MDYEVKVLDTRQGVTSLVLQALDDEDARRQAKVQGYAILSIRPCRRKISQMGRPRFSVLLFSQELRALIVAGLPLVEAIEALSENESGTAKAVLAQVVEFLYEGNTLSQSMARLPAIFPDLLVALIRASEHTGDLPEALSRYIAYQSQMDLVRKKIFSALLYPALLMLVGGGVLVFLMVYVVPRFSEIYSDLGDNLPFMSRLLMYWGQTLHAYGIEVATTFTVTVVLAAYGLSRPQFRQRLMSLLWSIPALGKRMRIYQLARFYRTLGMLQRGGIPMVQSLEMSANLLPVTMRDQLVRILKSVREGWSLSRAVDAHGLSTPISLRLLAVGERSGQLGEMLEQAAHFHDEELSRWIDGFVKLFEPILMAVIGILIGGIVVLMYMPVFELASSLQ